MGLNMTKKLGRLILVGVVGSLSGCSAYMSTGIDEGMVPPTPLPIQEMAVMPVTTEPGSEGLRPGMALALMEVMDARFPWLALMGPEEAGARLDQAGGAQDYADLLEDFDRTGVADSQRLAAVTRALGSDHFLQVRASYREEEFLDPLLFSYDEFDDETRQTLVLVARLWTHQGPGPVWEAVVRTTSETDDFREEEHTVDEIIFEVVGRLADRMPVAPPGQGPEG